MCGRLRSAASEKEDELLCGRLPAGTSFVGCCLRRAATLLEEEEEEEEEEEVGVEEGV